MNPLFFKSAVQLWDGCEIKYKIWLLTKGLKRPLFEDLERGKWKLKEFLDAFTITTGKQFSMLIDSKRVKMQENERKGLVVMGADIRQWDVTYDECQPYLSKGIEEVVNNWDKYVQADKKTLDGIQMSKQLRTELERHIMAAPDLYLNP